VHRLPFSQYIQVFTELFCLSLREVTTEDTPGPLPQ
jgi:hypothetical protein